MLTLATSIVGGSVLLFGLWLLCAPAAESLSEFLNRPEPGYDYDALPTTWPVDSGVGGIDWPEGRVRH